MAHASFPPFQMKSNSPLYVAAALIVGASLTGFGADAPKKSAPPAPAPAPAGVPKEAPAAPAEAKPYVLPETVATVEGVDIKKEELEKAFAAMLSSQGVTADAVPAAQKSQAYHMILDELIDEKLIEKRSADVKVTDEEFETEFQKFKGNFGTEDEMKAQLEKAGQSLEKIKGDIRNSLKARHWLEAQRKDAAPMTDEEAKAFYDKNPDQFQKPEQVRASHILIKVAEDAKPEDVVKKEKEAEAVLARVKAGEDFKKLATEISEDPSAKQNGGDLDFFTKERMVPEFSEAAFAMKKDDVSEPVRSKFGYHIIKVTDRKPAEKVSFESVKPRLIAYLERQKTQESMEKIIHDVREKADVKVDLPQ
jgi:peptidyl-prolyl cis-trans isomerase C